MMIQLPTCCLKTSSNVTVQGVEAIFSLSIDLCFLFVHGIDSVEGLINFEISGIRLPLLNSVNS